MNLSTAIKNDTARIFTDWKGVEICGKSVDGFVGVREEFAAQTDGSQIPVLQEMFYAPVQYPQGQSVKDIDGEIWIILSSENEEGVFAHKIKKHDGDTATPIVRRDGFPFVLRHSGGIDVQGESGAPIYLSGSVNEGDILWFSVSPPRNVRRVVMNGFDATEKFALINDYWTLVDEDGNPVRAGGSGQADLEVILE